MTHTIKKYIGFAALLCLTYASEPEAQTAGSPPAATTPGATDTLETVVVSGVALQDQVSPLQRPVSSVFGLDMSILDTPRAVTEINSAQMRDESIINVTDFAKVTSSAYTNDQFGGPNVPFLR